MTPRIYLAGPITGTSYDEATGWREQTAAALGKGFHPFSPMRGKEDLQGLESLPLVAGGLLETQHAIVARDQWDVRKSDAVIVNLVGAARVSIGTMFELAWCRAYGVPAVVVLTDGDMHDHPFVRESAYVVVSTIEEAIGVIRGLFNVDFR